MVGFLGGLQMGGAAGRGGISKMDKNPRIGNIVARDLGIDVNFRSTNVGVDFDYS